jgi:hypothetical protein
MGERVLFLAYLKKALALSHATNTRKVMNYSIFWRSFHRFTTLGDYRDLVDRKSFCERFDPMQWP